MKKRDYSSTSFKKLFKHDKATKLILSANSLIKPEELKISEKYLSDEELYYIALSVEEIKSVRAKRAIFDMIQIQCDGDSITRFLSYFSEKNKEEIMYSC